MPALNKQPIFTATPILDSLGLTPTENTDNTYNTSDATNIYTDSSTYGSMITKITVNANGKLTAEVVSQRVDLYVFDSKSSKYNLLSSKFMIGIASLTSTDPVPSVVFEFTEGLLVPPGGKLALSSTSATPVTIIVEGGTYDQPA